MTHIDNFVPFLFQSHTIEKAVEALKSNNGVFIMDETGLGKTITSVTTAINVMDNPKIFVVSPVVTKKSWEQVLSLTKCDYSIQTSNSVSKSTDDDYDVFIVDEAHKYGNHKGKLYLELFFKIRQQKKLPYVILLSATPINNKIEEFLNVLSLIPFPLDSAAFWLLGNQIPAIIDLLREIDLSDRYEEGGLSSMKAAVKRGSLNFRLDQAIKTLSKIISLFSFRNTRAAISEKYASDIELMGHFPKIQQSQLEYDFDEKIWAKIQNTLKTIDSMPLCRQNPLKYLSQSEWLPMQGIYKCFLFKRMESSIGAFKASLQNSLDKLLELSPGDENTPNNELFWEDRETDIEKFKYLIGLWRDETDKSKIDILFGHLCGTTEKTVVFTEYKDTLALLVERAKQEGLSFLEFHGNSDEKILDTVALEFDANLPQQTNDVQFLFCTDVLSESVNLHRTTNLIHYDNKWNPSRKIQREGRVNRILKNGISKSITISGFKTPYAIEKIIAIEEKIQQKESLAQNILKSIQYAPKFVGLTSPLFEDKKTMFVETMEISNGTIVVRTKNEDLMFDFSGPILSMGGTTLRQEPVQPIMVSTTDRSMRELYEIIGGGKTRTRMLLGFEKLVAEKNKNSILLLSIFAHTYYSVILDAKIQAMAKEKRPFSESIDLLCSFLEKFQLPQYCCWIPDNLYEKY